jgi:hypothetical protein
MSVWRVYFIKGGVDSTTLGSRMRAEALVVTARTILVWSTVRVTSRNLAEDLPSRNLQPS